MYFSDILHQTRQQKFMWPLKIKPSLSHSYWIWMEYAKAQGNLPRSVFSSNWKWVIWYQVEVIPDTCWRPVPRVLELHPEGSSVPRGDGASVTVSQCPGWSPQKDSCVSDLLTKCRLEKPIKGGESKTGKRLKLNRCFFRQKLIQREFWSVSYPPFFFYPNRSMHPPGKM